jgi:predicted regulator of Ras-like GTPase activity (Roadblock/LC7/MglB family)
MVSVRSELLDLLEELGAIQGVKGALIATSDGALAAGERSGLLSATANDVAKTVRRMTVASATVGVPLQELLINFGAARMMVTPLTEDATIVVLLERDTAVSPVRSLLGVQMTELRRLLADEDEHEGEQLRDTDDADEIARIMEGPLGPVLVQIRSQFSAYVLKAGTSQEEAEAMMRDQMREWLLCCNPSPYTFPLLIDGLGQLLNGDPTARGEFMEEVQLTIRDAQAAAETGG